VPRGLLRHLIEPEPPGFLLPSRAPREDQEIARPRHRDVEEAPRLGQLAGAPPLAERLAVGAPAALSIRSPRFHGETEPGLEQHPFRARIEGGRGALRDEHDRKFEPLRGVHGQQPHGVGIALLDHGGLRLARFLVRELAQVREKRADAVAANLGLAREREQLVDVRGGLLAMEAARAGGDVVGAREGGLEQACGTEAVGLVAQGAQQVAHPDQRLGVVRCEIRRVLEGPAPLGEEEERPVGERAEGRPQDRGERQIVLGIDRGGEERHQIHHLACAVEAAPLVDQVRDVTAQESAPERLEIREPAQQHGDVSAAHRPRGLAAVVDALGRSRCEKRGDPGRDDLRFRFHAGALDVEQLRAGRVQPPLAKRGQGIVGRERRIEGLVSRSQGAAEQQVGELDQRWPRAPRFAEDEALGSAREQPPGVSLRSRHVGATELVDGLLAVADHDHRPVACELLEDLDLRAAGILEFVHQQGADALALGSARGGVIDQQVAASAREIVEVEGPQPRLQLPVPLAGTVRERRQVARQRRGPHPGIGVQDRLERLFRRGDRLLVGALRAQLQRRATAHLSPGLRKLARGIRLQRRTGRGWRLSSGGEESGAQTRRCPIELTAGPGIVVEGGPGVGHELQGRSARLAELRQQRRHLVRETGAELALRPQPHLGAEAPGPVLQALAEGAFQRAQDNGLASLAQEPARLRFV